LRGLIDKAPPALDVYLDRMAAGVDLNSVTGRAKAIERLLPLISEWKEEVRRSLMLRRAAQRLDVDEAALRADLAVAESRPSPARRGPDVSPNPENPPPPGPPVRVNKLERQFAGLLLQYPRLLVETARRLDLDVFTDSEVRRLLEHLVGSYADGHLDLTALLNSVDEDLSRLVTVCAMETFVADNVDEIWQDHVLRLQREDLTLQIDEAKRAIRRVNEMVGAGEELDQLRTRQNELMAARLQLEAPR